jgi:hypothetical protein
MHGLLSRRNIEARHVKPTTAVGSNDVATKLKKLVPTNPILQKEWLKERGRHSLTFSCKTPEMVPFCTAWKFGY